MRRHFFGLLVAATCLLLPASAAAEKDFSFLSGTTRVSGVHMLMAYQDNLKGALGLHAYAIRHDNGVAAGLNFALYGKQSYSLGEFETIVGKEFAADGSTRLMLSSGLGLYGFGYEDGEVLTLSFPVRLHISFKDRIHLLVGSKLYWDMWSHPVPFSVGVAYGF